VHLFPEKSDASGFLEDERRRLLPRLIPPLVHRMNNALAVIQGLNEVGVEPGQAQVLAGEFEALRTLLARLSCFARQQPEVIEVFDLRELVVGVCQLLRPYAESVGIGLEFREPLQGAVLRNDPQRVEQLVAVIAASELAYLADLEPASKATRRLRLAVRQAPGRIVLTLVRPRIASQVGPTDVVGKAARWGDENAVSLYMRTMGEVTCYRFVFSSFEEQLEEELEPGFVERPKNLMLVEGDGPLCELIKTVCVEAGYNVTVAADQSFDPAAVDLRSIDLVLFDTDLELRRPGLLGRLEQRLDGTGGLLLLGEAPDGAGSGTAPCLPKPFRPHELMTAVSRHARTAIPV
jgi:hypothetical protein